VTAPPGWVDIHYRRLTHAEAVYRQRVVHRGEDVVVTLLESATVDKPVMLDGRVMLAPGSPIVWFTYPGVWHDIGRFHTADGLFTGLYANVLTPVEMDGGIWRTTDLCLDVWLAADGGLSLLDEDDLLEAERDGRVDPEIAAKARAEAQRVLAAAAAGDWPPAHVHDWTLERARGALNQPEQS
jgi:predicted RNA-binding protein associated with RNAse of E/G family